MAHAKFSPSKLSRIIACPASYRLSESIPDLAGEAAIEGTMLHEATEKTIEALLSGQEYNPHLTPEQYDAVTRCVDYFQEIYRELQLMGRVRVGLEERVSLEPLGIKDVYGTADVVMTVANETHIIDWKFGQGVFVSAQNNVQLKTYGLGATVCADVNAGLSTKIVTHVVQPRLNNFDYQEHTLGDLILWSDEVIAPALEAAGDPSTPCNPGDSQCQWCLAKGTCRARYEVAQQAAKEIFAMYQSKDPVTNEELKPILQKAKLLEKYIKDIKQRAQDLLLSGQDFPGYKMVKGRQSRQWKNPEAATSWLVEHADQYGYEIEDVLPTKFVTPPQAEKLAKAFKKDQDFLDLYKTVPGKPTMVADSDPREDCVANASKAFGAFAV